jgi:predicted DNA-binding transcriptional regulator YafY
MSLNKEAYLRYKIIDSCIGNKRKPFPSMNDIIQTLKEKLGKDFSVSTIQKDIKTLKEDDVLGYMAPIKYSKHKDGYYYTDSNYSINHLPLSGDEAQAMAETLELFSIIGDKNMNEEYRGAYIKLINSLSIHQTSNKEPIPFVVSQQAPQQWGFFHYKPLLEHIKKKEVIKFYYLNLSGPVDCVIVHPYQLLEFNHEWYLLAYTQATKQLKVYGFDRIMPEFDIIQTIKFNDSKRKQVIKFAKDMYGVYPLANEKKQLIEFYVSNKYKYLLETHPLHSSQKISPQYHELITKITINVIPTHELIRWFLAHCENVLVDSTHIKEKIMAIAKLRFEENKIALK